MGRLQKELGRALVGRERALDERLSRERDDADAVLLERVDEARQLEFRLLEAVGCYVLGEHAVRDVERDDHVHAAALHGDLARPRMRLAKRQHGENDRQRDQRALGEAPARVIGGRELLHERLFAEGPDLGPFPGRGQREKPDRPRDGPQPLEVFRVTPLHYPIPSFRDAEGVSGAYAPTFVERK